MIRKQFQRFNVWIDQVFLIPLYRKIQKDSPPNSKVYRFCQNRIQKKYKYREKVQ